MAEGGAAATARWAAKRKAEDPDGWRKRRTEIGREWRRRNREKMAAHNAVARALRKGVLQRPDACERCEKSCRPEASHDDYSQPLVVEWLCRKCHAKKDWGKD